MGYICRPLIPTSEFSKIEVTVRMQLLNKASQNQLTGILQIFVCEFFGFLGTEQKNKLQKQR